MPRCWHYERQTASRRRKRGAERRIADAMLRVMVADQIEAVFGISARELFEKRELFVQHGALERLPAFMFIGPLASTDSLCGEYAGDVEVSQGSELEG